MALSVMASGCAQKSFVFGPQPNEQSFKADRDDVFQASAQSLKAMGYTLRNSNPQRGRIEGFTAQNRGQGGMEQLRAVVSIRDADEGATVVSIWFSRIEEFDGVFTASTTQETYLRNPPATEMFFDLLAMRLAAIAAAQ